MAKRGVRFLIFGLLIVLFVSVPAWAQSTAQLNGIVKDHPYRAVLRIIDGATGTEIARYEKTFKTAVDQSTLPDDPLVVGPAYQQP